MSLAKRKAALTVALPASAVADTPHLREKTGKLGLIGRALAIFRAEAIIVYRDLDTDQRGDLRLIESILNYIAAPQYLRRALFNLTPELRYAGVLPPLRTPNHPLEKFAEELEAGDVREGLVVKSTSTHSFVDIGVEKLGMLHAAYPVNSRINVKICKLKDERIEVKPVLSEEIKVYWGFKVHALDIPLDKVVKQGHFDLTLATSRHGTWIGEIQDQIVERWSKARRVLVAFGSPAQGVSEILARRCVKPEELFDFTVNVIRRQGTQTMRVEEALFSSLAVLTLLMDD